LLDGLRTFPHPKLPDAFAVWVVDAVLRDRVRRRARVRRSLYVTAALAASILFMLLVAYFRPPSPGEGKTEPSPMVNIVPKPDVVPPPAGNHQNEPEKNDTHKHKAPETFAALTGRLADKTLDQAKALLTAANPIDTLPVGELPNVKELEPAAEPLRQAQQDATESLSAVTHSARRAFDYFARDLPMPDMPPNADPK
jgi:hypothetical protein